MSDPFLNTKPAWSDTAHLALLDSFYPSAHSLTEAQEQILRLKLELVDKERELELYLHVAARATEDAKETSRTTSENHELRDALHVARMRERTLQLMPPPGYAMPGPPAPSRPARAVACRRTTACATRTTRTPSPSSRSLSRRRGSWARRGG